MVGGDERPATRFASLGEDKIAYQVFGAGEVDLVYTAAAGDPIDLRWDWPPYATFLRSLGRGSRVVMFDPRGSGASDSPSGDVLPAWERWADDARAVMDAVAVERAVLFGTNNGVPSSILFAATHPKRTRGLIVGHGAARYLGPERSAAIFDATARFASEAWGTDGSVSLPCPDAARDPAYIRWATRSQRLAISPREAGAFFAAEAFMDVRDALPLVRVPTLVLHREGFNSFVPLEQGRYIADHIDGARFVTLPGRDAGLFMDPYDECLDELKAFLSSLRPATEAMDRSLAAILFTDIVGSTARASQVGDREWRRLLETHDAVARTIVEQHRGRFIKTTGDGILATFEGPGRAIQCGTALTDAFRPLGIEIRAGIHTGEIEFRDADIAGIAVHIAARVLDRADAGELLVSGAVPMLVAGAGYHFEDRGEHELKGVEGPWQLYAVTA